MIASDNSVTCTTENITNTAGIIILDMTIVARGKYSYYNQNGREQTGYLSFTMSGSGIIPLGGNKEFVSDTDTSLGGSYTGSIPTWFKCKITCNSNTLTLACSGHSGTSSGQYPRSASWSNLSYTSVSIVVTSL